MSSPIRCAVFASLTCSLALAACSKEVPSTREALLSPEAAATTVPEAPTGDPCAVIRDGEVRDAFEGARSGKRDHSIDKYDIATCIWETPTNTLVVQLFKAAGTAEDELRSRASGVIDPVKPGAGKHIRYTKLADAGDDAWMAAEKGDEASGIYNDFAAVTVRKGDQMAVIFARSHIDADRAKTLDALTALGRSAGKRL